MTSQVGPGGGLGPRGCYDCVQRRIGAHELSAAASFAGSRVASIPKGEQPSRFFARGYARPAAEASRFTELRTLLEGELRRMEARIEQSERGMQEKLAEATGTLSAYLGEIEDKLDRALVPGDVQGTLASPER